jgi:transcriptional regulator with GAF, ATPase, and Fis domain
MIRLIIVEDEKVEIGYFTGETVTMGRDPGNSICSRSKSASRRHCRIERMAGGFKIIDLNSQNGTRVNGQQVTQKRLREGDRIEMGPLTIWFQDAPEEILARAPEYRDRNLDRLRRDTAELKARLEAILGETESKLGAEGLRMAEGELQDFLGARDLSYYRKLEERYAKLVRLQTILHAIASEHDTRRLMTLVLDSAIEITQAERGFLITRNDEGVLDFTDARNFDGEYVKKPVYKISRSLAEQVMSTGEAVLSSDAQQDDRFASYLSVADLQLCSILGLPIKVGDEVLGVLYLDNRFARGAFSKDDLDILAFFANQAGIALVTSRLIDENQEEELRALEEASGVSREEAPLRYDYSRIVGKSPEMREVFRLLDKVIPSEVPVLIQGSSGTGKELIAHAIHEHGPRKSKPFVSENCAAIPETLLESELFGHKRGAFTGADRDTPGLFVEAHKGTLFLDEIGDMSVEMQKKLLRALQEGEVRPVGGKETIKVDVRVISASNKDLRKLVGEGLFREDLLYRLNVITVRIPDLKKRRDDIPLLIDHFIRRIAAEVGMEEKSLSPKALMYLLQHDWPGNVRELENEMRKAMTLSEATIEPDVLSEEIRPRGTTPNEGPVRGPAGPLKEIVRREVERIEREIISQALLESSWNKSEASRTLGVSRPTLDAKIAAYDLKKEES